MSRNSPEPFRRWRLSPDDRNPPTFQHRPDRASDNPSTMSQLTVQLPPLPALLLGLDTFRPRQTMPDVYETRPRSLRSIDPQKPVCREKLPPVSQLLTPSSQSSLPPSPFSSSYSVDSPTSVHSGRPSSTRDWPPDRHGKINPQSYSDSVGTTTLPALSRGQSYCPAPAEIKAPSRANTFAFPFSSKQEQTNPPYSSYHHQSRSDPSVYTHRQSEGASRSEYMLPYRPSEPSQQSDFSPSRSRHQRESSNLTQHTPRPFKEEIVPGEGPCYVYEDGSHCRKVIDGEVVNASWGVTKAGKPRKRLAVACMTCREKKIKCEPNLPKCVQCEKFGRECKFQNVWVLLHSLYFRSSSLTQFGPRLSRVLSSPSYSLMMKYVCLAWY